MQLVLFFVFSRWHICCDPTCSDRPAFLSHQSKQSCSPLWIAEGIWSSISGCAAPLRLELVVFYHRKLSKAAPSPVGMNCPHIHKWLFCCCVKKELRGGLSKTTWRKTEPIRLNIRPRRKAPHAALGSAPVVLSMFMLQFICFKLSLSWLCDFLPVTQFTKPVLVLQDATQLFFTLTGFFSWSKSVGRSWSLHTDSVTLTSHIKLWFPPCDLFVTFVSSPA